MNSQIEPPKYLLEKIMKSIHREERVLVLRKIVLFSFILVASAVAFIPAFKMLSAGFAQSGFLSFFSLIFSDFSTIASYWKSFTLILLETLPAMAIVLFLALLLVFLESLKLLTKNIKIIRRFAIN